MSRTREQNRLYQAKRRDMIREYMKEQKNKPCYDCGQRFPPVCMDFHHVRGDKKFELSCATQGARSFRIIQEEIDKCILLCACCHRLRHEHE